MKTRVAGIIPLKDGFAFMHRVGNKENKIQDYYVFAGGGLENGETLEQGTQREIKEEFGIDVQVKELLYQLKNEELNQTEYFFLCEYQEGEFGTGQGPEFNNDPKYKSRGKHIPEIIKEKDVDKIILLPYEIRDKFVQDVKKGRF